MTFVSFSSGLASTRATTNCRTTKTKAPISTKCPTTPNRNIKIPRLKIAAQSLVSAGEATVSDAFEVISGFFGAVLTASGFVFAAFTVDVFLAGVFVVVFFGAAFAVVAREAVFFAASGFADVLAGDFVVVAGFDAFVRDVVFLGVVGFADALVEVLAAVVVVRVVLLVVAAFLAVVLLAAVFLGAAFDAVERVPVFFA